MGSEQYETYARNYMLGRNYGITAEEYDVLLEAQNGRCALCRDVPSNRRLHVDHNHITGKIRGLLCHKCNIALGMFRDNPRVIAQALVYLEDDGIKLEDHGIHQDKDGHIMRYSTPEKWRRYGRNYQYKHRRSTGSS
jgi:hypothetical protein